MYTYSRSQGLFAGISLEGTIIATRDEANAEYYGKPVAAREILSGKCTATGRCEEVAGRFYRSSERQSQFSSITHARDSTIGEMIRSC